MEISYRDIVNRKNDVISGHYTGRSTVNILGLYEDLHESYSYNKAKLILENWYELSSTDIGRLDKVLEVFDIIVDNDNVSNIRNAANIIEGTTIKKVRTGPQTRHLNNYKLGKLKIQNTKVLNHTKDNTTAVERAKANGGYLGNSLHPNRKYPRDIFGNKLKPKEKTQKEEQEEAEKEEVRNECVERFCTIAEKNVECDRILANYDTISSRYDFDSMVRKCSLTEDGMEDCIHKICEAMESYNLPFDTIYNTLLENTYYVFKKNCVDIEPSFLIETVTDYFVSKDITDDMVRDMEFVIEHSKLFRPEDFSEVSYLVTDEQEVIDMLHEDANAIYDLISYLNEEGEAKPVIDWVKGKHKNNAKRVKKLSQYLKFKRKKKIKETDAKAEAESLEIKKELHDFKKSRKKNIGLARDTLSRIFCKSPEAIVKELPDIFKFIRILAYVSTFSFNAVLGLVVLITSLFLKMKVSRDYMAKVVKEYTKERDKYKKKMDNASNDRQKEKYEKLYKQFKKDVETLEMYENDLYTDAENEKREEEKWAKEAKNGDVDDDFNFDIDFNFDESAAIEAVTTMANIMESTSYDSQVINTLIRNSIDSLDSSAIYDLSESVSLCADIFDTPKYIQILEYALYKERSKDTKSYMKIDALKNSITSLEETKYDVLMDGSDLDFSNEDGIPFIEDACDILKYKYNVVNDTIDMLSSRSTAVLEGDGMSFTSKLKMAKENLKNKMVKLKNKDKAISMKMDSELERTKKSVERAMVSNSREQIIKGSFLPSASKCIHIAIASGAAFLVSPALAVIGLLGYIGTSKKLSNKERVLILDDIETEIKMCDKYMKIAEDKDDLVAVREIMKVKRDLERQRARIIYNKKYLYKGKKQYDYTPDSIKNPDND